VKKINKIKNSKGFTLFELLVSISIIAILTAVAVVSFGGMNKKTRDARRISDVEKIRVALESYKQVNGMYPAVISNLVTAKFLDKEPTDPKNTSTKYQYSSTNATYYLCAAVELAGSVTTDQTNCVGKPSGYPGYYKAIQP
jgi:general secretion pathway protein G